MEFEKSFTWNKIYHSNITVFTVRNIKKSWQFWTNTKNEINFNKTIWWKSNIKVLCTADIHYEIEKYKILYRYWLIAVLNSNISDII